MPRRHPSVAVVFRHAVVAIVALFAAGCSSPVGGAVTCTQIGCIDGLFVRFDVAPPPGAVRVELLPEGESGPRYTYDCAATDPCHAGVRFPGFTGDYAVVRVTTSAGVVNHEVRPTYAESRPNGKDCPPLCRHGTVTVSPRA